MAEQWLSIVEYARTFGISDMTIRRRIRTGRIQAYLRDGKYYIPIETDPATGEPIKQGSKPKTPIQAAMKSHPSAERTLPKVIPAAARQEIAHDHYVNRATPPFPAQAPETRIQKPDTRPAAAQLQYNQIPNRLVASVSAEQEVSVEAHALLEYCNSSLATAKDIERHIENRYSAQLDTAREQIKNREAEISKLNQQIEDLQLLVQILERKRA